MDFDLENLNLSAFILENHLHEQKFLNVFGNIPNSLVFNLGIINPSDHNHWVWFHNINSNLISFVIYSFFHRRQVTNDNWVG